MCWFIELRFVKIRSQKEQGNFLPKCKESLWAWKQKVEKLKTLIVATLDWVFSPLNLISVRNFCRSQGTEISQLLQYASPFYAQIWGWREGKKVFLFKVSVGWREMKVTGNGHWILLDTFLDRFWLVGAVNCVSKQTSLREASKGTKRSTLRSQFTISQKYNCVWNLFCHYAIFIQQALEALLLYEIPSQQTPDEMEITCFSALLFVLIDPGSTNLKSLRCVRF